MQSGHTREERLGEVTHRDLNLSIEPAPGQLLYCVVKKDDVKAIQAHGIRATEMFGFATDRAKIKCSTLDPTIRCVQFGDRFAYNKPYDGSESKAIQKAHNEGKMWNWPALLTDAKGKDLEILQ